MSAYFRQDTTNPGEIKIENSFENKKIGLKIFYFGYKGENETYIEASVENSGSILYDKEIHDKPRTRRTKRNV